MYEDAIKNYDGDDPLECWYEYIIWVEQSYPKSGHESHIGKLLQQCLAIFEKETKYHQDRRYIRLWINYVRSFKEMSTMEKRNAVLDVFQNKHFVVDKYAEKSIRVIPAFT